MANDCFHNFIISIFYALRGHLVLVFLRQYVLFPSFFVFVCYRMYYWYKPIKVMILVVSEILCWFWIMCWSIIFTLTCYYVMSGLTKIIIFTCTVLLINSKRVLHDFFLWIEDNLLLFCSPFSWFLNLL